MAGKFIGYQTLESSSELFLPMCEWLYQDKFFIVPKIVPPQFS